MNRFPYLLLLLGLVLLPGPWCQAQNAVPQIAYEEFVWKGAIKDAHTHAVDVLRAAAYKIPEQPQNEISSAYGVLPKDTDASTLVSHILCLPVKKKAQSLTKVLIIVAGCDATAADAECQRLKQLMRQDGKRDRLDEDSTGRGNLSTRPTGNIAANDVWLVDTYNLYSARKGKLEDACGAAYSFLSAMSSRPIPTIGGIIPRTLHAGRISDNVIAFFMATEDELTHQIHVHCYAGVCYLAPKNADPSQLSKARSSAHEIAQRYVTDMTRAIMEDKGSGKPGSRPK